MKKLFLFFISLSLFSFSLEAAFLEAEQKIALKEKKLILLTVEKEGCPFCLKMQTEIFNDPKYARLIAQKYLHVSIRQSDSILPKALHVKYFPTNLILSPANLEIIDEFAGYMQPDSFLELLNEVYSQEFK